MTYSPEDQRRILEEATRRFGGRGRFDSLEDVLVRGYGLQDRITPLQRAIARIIDGQPLEDLKHHPHVRKAIGDVSRVEGRRPKKVALCAGIRTFKSMLAGGVGVRSPQVVDTAPLLDREGARFSVVSTSKDNARKVLSHGLSLLHGKDQAAAMLSGDPGADSFKLKHQEGREFTFKVVHGGRAGAGLVSDWSAGAVFDEAARMLSSDQGVINLDDGIDAVEGRLLPGAQLFLLSSPWAPFGTFYEYVTGNHRKPTPDLVVIWAEAQWLNPGWWTEERCEDLKRNNYDAYQTDVLAKFRSPEESIFSDAILEPARRHEPVDLPPKPGCTYVAAMDPATRRNAWTLVVVTRDGPVRVAMARQWMARNGEPLRPRSVLKDIAATLKPYGVTDIVTDQWSLDALQDIASEFGLALIETRQTGEEKNDAYGKIKTLLEEGEFELHPDPHLRDDLLRVKKKTTQTGVSIVLPLTGDGRHCDYAPPLALAAAPFLPEYEKPMPPAGTKEYWAERERLDIQREIEQIEDQQERPWWNQG